jgi:ubiquinone/menaquinone biosynthesis C-methylase UbiE/DNA-binding transcriptional ArsR family regulator
VRHVRHISLHTDEEIELLALDSTVGWLHLFGDPTRVRLLTLVAHEELTVAELTTITELAQPRVSTHLGKLREAGLLRDRKVGASTFYSVNEESMPPAARALWKLLRAEVQDTVLDSDRKRMQQLVRARDKAASWPDAVAGQMERHYSPGRTWEATARGLIGLLRLGDVLDAGSGDGAIAQLLAPRARSVTCLDRSERVMAAARARLGREGNVRFTVGELHELAFADRMFDHVLLFNVLTYAHTPARVIGEAARVLRPKGDLVVVTLEGHQHRDVTSAYQHVNDGFTVAALKKMLQKAGLAVESCAVSSREKREPHFQVITAVAHKP